jgi:membrane protein required for beta-lactamase induction
VKLDIADSNFFSFMSTQFAFLVSLLPRLHVNMLLLAALDSVFLTFPWVLLGLRLFVSSIGVSDDDKYATWRYDCRDHAVTSSTFETHPSEQPRAIKRFQACIVIDSGGCFGEI